MCTRTHTHTHTHTHTLLCLLCSLPLPCKFQVSRTVTISFPNAYQSQSQKGQILLDTNGFLRGFNVLISSVTFQKQVIKCRVSQTHLAKRPFLRMDSVEYVAENTDLKKHPEMLFMLKLLSLVYKLIFELNLSSFHGWRKRRPDIIPKTWGDRTCGLHLSILRSDSFLPFHILGLKHLKLNFPDFSAR